MNSHDDEEFDQSSKPIDEGPDSFDLDDDETIPCPTCKKPIHDTSEWCPYCGQNVIEEQAPMSKPMWVALVIVVLMVLYILLRRQF